jgi:adenosylcobinamide-GDP ribazoletransferase
MTGRLATAIRFLTSFPLPPAIGDERVVGRSIGFFPAVGLLLGLLVLLAAWLAGDRLPLPVVSTGLVALLALLTGGIHLDGVADLFDALGGGGGDRDRTLTLLRDSRIGAHGAAALILVLVGKIVALQAVLESASLRALVAAPTAARFVAVVLVASFPYAREQGLGRAFKEHCGAREVAEAAITTALVAAWAGSAAWLALAFSLVAGCLLAARMTARLGGLTGDVYGAAIELAELTFLVAWLAVAG